MICQRQSKSVYLTTPDAHQPGLHNDRSSSRRKKLPPDVCRSCGHPVRLSRARAARSRACADSLPENRLHGVIAGKLYPYARFRRWPHGIEITQIIRNASMTDTPVSAAVGLIRSKRFDDPVCAAIAAELATARLDRDGLVHRLIVSLNRTFPGG